jgi:hypothetical protein
MLRMHRVAAFLGLVTLAIQGADSPARGQAVAFIPIPAPAFNGQTVTVTPAVSADRRYVRLSVNPYFNVINGFSTFSTQLGAVGGGGGGALNAGMNGVIGQQGVDDGSGFGPSGYYGQIAEMRAGPVPATGGLGANDPLLMADGFGAGLAVGWDGWPEGNFAATADWPLAEVAPRAIRPGRSVKAAAKSSASKRRAARKSLARSQGSSSTRPRAR